MANFGPISELSVLELPPWLSELTAPSMERHALMDLDQQVWISRTIFIRCEPHQRRVLCHDPIVVDHY
jgi:hypothetical protein